MKIELSLKNYNLKERQDLITKIINVGRKTDEKSPQISYSLKSGEAVIDASASQLKTIKELMK